MDILNSSTDDKGGNNSFNQNPSNNSNHQDLATPEFQVDAPLQWWKRHFWQVPAV
ncbi:MAG: hypothetical protein HC874_11510 [Richelia sp. SL_2_1]|nr:hypothetical protein [Richelia sp. SL_2_1]